MDPSSSTLAPPRTLPPAQAQRSGVPALALGWSISVLASSGVSLIGSLEPTITRDLHIGHTAIGVIGAAVFLGNVAGSILLAVWGDRISLKYLGVAAAALLVAGNAVSMLPHLSSLVLGGTLIGLATAAVTVFASAVVIHRFSRHRAGLLGMTHAVAAGSSALWLSVGGAAAALAGGWPAMFGWLACICVLPLLAGGVMGGHDHADAARFDLAALREVLAHRAFWPLAGVLAGYIATETAFSTFFVGYCKSELGIASGTTARGLAAIFCVGVVGGRAAIVLLAKIWSERRLLIWMSLAGGAVLALTVVFQRPVLIGAALLVGGFGIGPAAPLGVSLAVHRIARHERALLALTNLMLCVGGLFGSIGIGFVGDHVSLKLGIFLGTLVLPLTVVPVVWWMRE